MIEVIDVEKNYGRKKILKGISLQPTKVKLLV